MNSDTTETAVQFAKDAGAIVQCADCHGYDVRAYDDDAESMAYAQATNAWKDGVRGFRGMSREEVVSVVKSVLDDALIECPSCQVASDA